jgi:undecaprenyl diphosphate synthase
MIKHKSIPKHIAIIMDGNGRWAKEKNLNRTAGHEQGAVIVKNITEHCAKIGIKYLSLYAFSTENWNRPKLEVEFLMKLLQRYLKNQRQTYIKHNIKFKAIGDISKFSTSLQNTIKEIENITSSHTTMTQILALNYGSKDEIVRAVKQISLQNLEINEQNITNNLDTKDIPSVDMLIRTSGEIRISNFMLWQSAYAEMFFTDTYWPDFTSFELDDLIDDFTSRNRRFGAL